MTAAGGEVPGGDGNKGALVGALAGTAGATCKRAPGKEREKFPWPSAEAPADGQSQGDCQEGALCGRVCQLSARMTVPGPRGASASGRGVCVCRWPIVGAKGRREVRLQTRILFIVASRV